jgi:hypothetical protein
MTDCTLLISVIRHAIASSRRSAQLSSVECRHLALCEGSSNPPRAFRPNRQRCRKRRTHSYSRSGTLLQICLVPLENAHQVAIQCRCRDARSDHHTPCAVSGGWYHLEYGHEARTTHTVFDSRGSQAAGVGHSHWQVSVHRRK